jgi:hypothetical protein
MEALTFEKADLEMELQFSLVEGGFTGKMIKHPLVNEIFYVPEMNAHYNKVLAYKKEAVAEAYAKKEWHLSARKALEGSQTFWHHCRNRG